MNDMTAADALPESVEAVPNPIAATAPVAPPEPAKPLTVAESVAKAAEKVLGEAKPEPEEPDVKPEVKEPKAEKPAVKAEPDEAKVDAKAEPEKPAEKQVNAPSRLLPKAREVWANTPRVVQAEFERFEREIETERQTHKAASDFHAELREYDDMAKGAKTTVKQALDRYVNFDKALSQDFGQGMAMIAQDQGKKPIEAVASLLRALGTTPEQYAQHVMQNPQAHQIAPAQQQQRQSAPDPVMAEIQQLKQQLRDMGQQTAHDRIHAEIIAPFAADHPRFAELTPAIEKLLKSDIVPVSLSAADRLDAAYDMAERLNPSPVARATVSDPDREVRSSAGNKSISGAPGTNSTKAKPKIMSIPEVIAAQRQKFGLA